MGAPLKSCLLPMMCIARKQKPRIPRGPPGPYAAECEVPPAATLGYRPRVASSAGRTGAMAGEEGWTNKALGEGSALGEMGPSRCSMREGV